MSCETAWKHLVNQCCWCCLAVGALSHLRSNLPQMQLVPNRCGIEVMIFFIFFLEESFAPLLVRLGTHTWDPSKPSVSTSTPLQLWYEQWSNHSWYIDVVTSWYDMLWINAKFLTELFSPSWYTHRYIYCMYTASWAADTRCVHLLALFMSAYA